jgi:hypothetical protein
MQQPELGRGHVQRVKVARLAGRELLLLDVRLPGETAYLVCASGVGVGVVGAEQRASLREAMRSAGPSPSQPVWRARLEGARINRIGVRAIELARDGAVLGVVPGKTDASLLVPGEMADADTADRATLEQRGAEMVRAIVETCAGGRHDALRRALGKAVRRVERRIAAVQGDLAQMDSADRLAQRAQLFVAAAATARRGASKLSTVDWTSGEAREVDLELDPARSAKEQVDALFKRARRLKEGAKIARARLFDAEASLDKLKAAEAALLAESPDFMAVEISARAAAPRDFKLAAGATTAGSRARPDPPRAPYRTFVGASGARVLVGRGAAHNDALTLHVARPHDLWVHAKGKPGAHVVVPLEKGASCPSDLLVEAAHLAAHFSDARDETLVEVEYTPRRYVRKPRGSAPGLVVVEREKVIALRRDDEALRRLLASEVVV